ncbi:uncharacterized protein LOC119312718 [Triticum dicoccoides]|uniref:uncharacterized protein LOC119312718 n=1 Tax=Triticum dicoccoides TaxID=85692 RepID=UPI001891E874|nr:uncharacterized protein LOC119312718 [Triticum dicoccoides]
MMEQTSAWYSSSPRLCCWASDGAAAIVLVSGEKAKNLGLQVLARTKGHLSYLQKEGTWPSSCLAEVSSFDSFLQQGGDPAFFMSRATRVIDTDYGSLVGVVLFNHSEVDFAVRPGDRATRMIIH